MQIRNIERAEIENARQFLAANGWAGRVANQAQFVALVLNSQRVAVAIEKDRIIGFARAITDGISNGYLSMIAVDAAHRGQGLGRRLVEHLTRDNPAILWAIHAQRQGAVEFCESLGFRETGSILVRPRR